MSLITRLDDGVVVAVASNVANGGGCDRSSQYQL